MKLQPKCLHGKDLAYVPSGHMTPCCWTNVSWNDPYLKDMFTDMMHIDNFNSVEEILESEPWRRFFQMLKHNPLNAPYTCKKMCNMPLNVDVEGERKYRD